MSLTSATKVKEWAGISGSGDDSLLLALCTSTDALVEKILNGRSIEAADHIAQFDGTGTGELWLPHFPINSLAGIWIDPAYDFEDDDILVALEDYTWDSASGVLLRLGTTWTPGVRNVKVSWNGGYDAVPADVEQAANMIVADWYTRHKQLQSGQSQNEMLAESIGGQLSQNFRAEGNEWGIPEPALAILKRYRNPA